MGLVLQSLENLVIVVVKDLIEFENQIISVLVLYFGRETKLQKLSSLRKIFEECYLSTEKLTTSFASQQSHQLNSILSTRSNL